MIIKGSERANSKELAVHLLNDSDNDIIHVHDLRGFVASDLTEAMKEAQAISHGTKCENHLFSVSFNPPENEVVSIEVFEEAIQRLEGKLGLQTHARAIVFHEKQGRRHAHAVWSRIDPVTMKAKNLSHYKLKCQDVSRALYLVHDWKMPRGLARKGHSDPRNFTLAEWQHSKKSKRDPRDIKAEIQDAYAISDDMPSFANALSDRGYILAKGDRRGHVAVSHDGQVFSIARYVGKKAKQVRAKLGDPSALPSVEEAQRQIALDMRQAFTRHAEEARANHNQLYYELLIKQKRMKQRHKQEREKLYQAQQIRWGEEVRYRSERLNSGLRGLWQRVTGQHSTIQKRNELEAITAVKRDRMQMDYLIAEQMRERRKLHLQIRAVQKCCSNMIKQIDRAHSTSIALYFTPLESW